MNRTILILALGLAVGAGAHLGFFQLHRPRGLDSLDGQLAWIRDELKLTDAQYARIRELHEASSPQLRALASQVARMQDEFTAFENTRKTADRVDFMEFAKFVEARRTINRQCAESTRRLVLATAELMTPQQRAQYLGIVAATNPPKPELVN